MQNKLQSEPIISIDEKHVQKDFKAKDSTQNKWTIAKDWSCSSLFKGKMRENLGNF